MMKSPTSLITIRNAVGVMLAMSAIFAVVLTAVTITNEKTFAQDPNPTVTLTVDAETVTEGATVTFTVELSAAVATGADPVEIPITVTDGTAMKGTDFTLPQDTATPTADITSVTFQPGDTTQTYTITTIDTPDPEDDTSTAYDEPQESFTVSLGTLPSGYDAGATTSFTININDGDNVEASPPTVTIHFNDADGNLIVDEQDPPQPVTGRIAKSGESLVADTSTVVDGDQPLTPDPDDDAAARVPPDFNYQWIRTNDGSTTVDDPDEAIEGANDRTYTLTDDDVGDTFTVQVWSSDDFGNGNGNASPAVQSTDSPAVEVVAAGNNGQPLTQPAATSVVAYNQTFPFIIIGELQPEGDMMRLEPGTELTRDVSGMTSTMTNVDTGADLVGDDGMAITVDLDDDDPDNDGFLEDGTTPATERTTVTIDAVSFIWHRDEQAIMECDENTGLRDGGDNDTFACTGATYTLTNDDVAKEIALWASYVTRTAVAGDPTATPPVPEVIERQRVVESENIGRVFSPNLATGMPVISGVSQVGSMLSVAKGEADQNGIQDADGSPEEDDITYTWFHGDDDDYSDPLGTGTSYDLKPDDVDKTIKVLASFNDGLGDPEMRTSGLTTKITGSPGEVSRIEPTIRSVTVSPLAMSCSWQSMSTACKTPRTTPSAQTLSGHKTKTPSVKKS